jgi:hypothetical protein
MAAKFKTAGAMGSALPDPVSDSAAIAPLPAPAIPNKPAPGQTGPRGMAPRTTYSRVNTGSPPVLDAGASIQKSGPNRGMESLPAKVAASRGSTMTMKERPLLQDMVKAAMSGTRHRLEVNSEAARQSQRGTVKTAAPMSHAEGHVPTELVHKLAGALGFIQTQIIKEADLTVGEGPNHMQVLEATSSESNIDAGESGQATPQNQQPKDPPLQPEKVQEGNAGTGLATNDDTTHPEQPEHPIKNASALQLQNLERLSKVAGPVGEFAGKAKEVLKGSKAREAFGKFRNARNNLAVATKERAPGKITNAIKGDVKEHGGKALREGAKTVGAYAGIGAAGAGGAALAKGKKKEGGAPIALLRKLAEDAINPAHISSPANVNPAEPPPGASASGEDQPSEPGDVTSQKRLISSNEAAINYTKREAKSDPKSDVAQVLHEPPLSSATDKVLERSFDHTGQAGVKISSARGMQKTAAQVGAQRVLLDRLLKVASAAADKDSREPGKDKRSAGMAPTTPQAATGANAATMGM